MNAHPPVPLPSPARAWPRRLVFATVASLGLCGAMLLATLMFGAVGGEEFCPDTFSRRSFLYYELPLVGLQITPIRRRDETQDLEKHLTKHNYVPSGKAAPQWHLVNSMRSGVSRVRGDAAILCEYLDANADKRDSYWKAWTEQHPELAKILWPAVAQTASRKLYFFVPDLFDLRTGRPTQPRSNATSTPPWRGVTDSSPMSSRNSANTRPQSNCWTKLSSTHRTTTPCSNAGRNPCAPWAAPDL